MSNQSDARAALRLSGPHVRDMLAKGCMIDLHPSVFPPGAAAMTSIAHIGVHLWRLDNAAPRRRRRIRHPRRAKHGGQLLVVGQRLGG